MTARLGLAATCQPVLSGSYSSGSAATAGQEDSQSPAGLESLQSSNTLPSELLGVVSSHQGLDLCDLSQCLPVSCPLRAPIQCWHRPQPLLPASTRTRREVRPHPLVGALGAGSPPPLCSFPREPSCCLKPSWEGP